MSSTENRDVSVVILTRNSAATIERCLRSVARQKPYEIIAVDMISGDETLDILKRYGARIVTNPYRSLGYSRQLGVYAAQQAFLMFVDSDVELGDGCIAKLRCDIEKHGWAGILATVLSSENKSYWQKAGQENYSLFAHRLGPTNYIGTGATLFRKHVLLEHQFDVDFEESLEDVDLCRRLVEANCPLGVSSATAYHSLPRDFLAFFKHQLRDGRGNARLALKYRSTWILVSPLFNVLHVVIYGTLTGRIRLIPFWLVANSAKFLGTVLGALEIRNERPKAKTQAMLTSEEQGLSGQPVVRPDTMCS